MFTVWVLSALLGQMYDAGSIDAMGDRLSKAAGEYERANIVAASYERTGDQWRAAVGYKQAAESAENMAEGLSVVVELIDKHGQYDETAEYRHKFAERSVAWSVAAANAWSQAANLASDAGREQASMTWSVHASNAQSRAVDLASDVAVTKAVKDVTGLMDRLADTSRP